MMLCLNLKTPDFEAIVDQDQAIKSARVTYLLQSDPGLHSIGKNDDANY